MRVRDVLSSDVVTVGKAPLTELVDIMDVGWVCAYRATPFVGRITGGTVFVDGDANIGA